MPIYKGTFFRESALAHQLLDGLKGLEIGGSRHNQWGLDIVNCDKWGEMDTVYKKAELELCGEALPVDIVADGDCIPVPDKSFDFVISSHVIEHFFDPIKALKEWARIARKYIYIICPQPNALDTDRGKLITPLDALFARHRGEIPDPHTDEHHTRWTCETFKKMCAALGFYVSNWQEVDDKVGNGFTVVIDLQPQGIKTGYTAEEMATAFRNFGKVAADALEKSKNRKK